jgi:hypothetical protein
VIKLFPKLNMYDVDLNLAIRAFTRGAKWGLLKSGQNKKAEKFSSCTIYWIFKICKKGFKNGAARKVFGPSFFVIALVWRYF